MLLPPSLSHGNDNSNNEDHVDRDIDGYDEDHNGYSCCCDNLNIN